MITTLFVCLSLVARRSSLVARVTRHGSRATSNGEAEEHSPTLASSVRSPQDYVGSSSCRECHERFYQLWAPSHHGLAMQPYSAEFARRVLIAQREPITVGQYQYQAQIGPDQGYIIEKGPNGQKNYPMVHVLGGKNVYYFLTPYERGRLQTLPVAYDVNRKKWFDTAASGIRHFPGADTDHAVHWTDPLYTFNTSCYSCHVSQLSTNYDAKTDSYHTRWSEPGINCEACHGPGQEHVRLCRAAPEGKTPDDLKIIITRAFTPEQLNSMCNSCHAKMNIISASFRPGEKYFDHFDLITLENPDFYPDGRDLGENYTMTSWRMSPCVKSGKLDCMHCHTSSGRYRFKDPAKANQACLPCHQDKVTRVADHSHHAQKKGAPNCISCHMPMTQFAHMNRSDHSMRPPAPGATMKYKSPNACNLCHQDKEPRSAHEQLCAWNMETHQNQLMALADLVAQARRQDWRQLDRMLAYVRSQGRDEIFAASLIRLLRACDAEEKWPVLIERLNHDSSPLVRAAAAEALDGYLTGDSLKALLKGIRDAYRLVRVRAAASLAAVPPDRLMDDIRKDLERVTAELIQGLTARGDDYIAHYNLGNIHMKQRAYDQAHAAYQIAIKLRPDFVPSYVNLAFVFNAKGQNTQAERSFRKALELESDNLIAQINLAMLLGEMGRNDEAVRAFHRVLEIDPNSAPAAYNLGVMLSSENQAESLTWCRRAYELRPDVPKYGYTYAFYLHQGRKGDAAIEVLNVMTDRKVVYPGAYALLGAIYEERRQVGKAVAVYRKAAQNSRLSPSDRYHFDSMIRRLQK